jgi:hypothetical protein
MCGALMISKLPHYHTIYHILPQKENNTLSTTNISFNLLLVNRIKLQIHRLLISQKC